MNSEYLIASIFEACCWVSEKSKGNNKLTPTCGVRMVDWDLKHYSPLFCFYWKESAKNGNLYNPNPILAIPSLAELTKRTPEFLELLSKVCYYNGGTRIKHDFELSIEDGVPILKNQYRYNEIFCRNQGILDIAQELNKLYPSKRVPAELDGTFQWVLQRVPSEKEYQHIYPQRFTVNKNRVIVDEGCYLSW